MSDKRERQIKNIKDTCDEVDGKMKEDGCDTGGGDTPKADRFNELIDKKQGATNIDPQFGVVPFQTAEDDGQKEEPVIEDYGNTVTDTDTGKDWQLSPRFTYINEEDEEQHQKEIKEFNDSQDEAYDEAVADYNEDDNNNNAEEATEQEEDNNQVNTDTEDSSDNTDSSDSQDSSDSEDNSSDDGGDSSDSGDDSSDSDDGGDSGDSSDSEE